MRVAVQTYLPSVMADLLDALAGTAERLGCDVVRNTARVAYDAGAVSVVWNGRSHVATGPSVYCEHGWFPRSDFQLSPTGINAGSHLSPFRWDGVPLSPEVDAALEAHMAAIRSASHGGFEQYMEAGAEPADGLPSEFLLVPLQIKGDLNLVRYAPPHLQTMQALVDYVSAIDPPWPVVFKQHPVDVRSERNVHLGLRLSRPHDVLWPHARGNVHQVLRSGRCRGILTINSNVAHDGLLWDVPAVVLGRNLWPTTGVRPFLTAPPDDWSALEDSATSPEGRACRRAYAWFLARNQWTLADANDPARVAALFEDAVRRGPPPPFCPEAAGALAAD